MSNQNELPKAKARECSPDAAGGNIDPTAELKQGLETSRLPVSLKAQILAELPSPEERERLFRELKEQGGLSSEEFFASLDPEAEAQP